MRENVGSSKSVALAVEGALSLLLYLFVPLESLFTLCGGVLTRRREGVGDAISAQSVRAGIGMFPSHLRIAQPRHTSCPLNLLLSLTAASSSSATAYRRPAHSMPRV